MIDKDKVKDFWLARGEKYLHVPFESVANLEEDAALLQLKIRIEQEQVMPRLQLSPEQEVLDLGAGCGQWSLRFAPLVRSVTAVEFSASLVRIGRMECDKRGVRNVTFVESAAEDFIPSRTWPLVFISGLFVYLNDEQTEAVVKKAAQALAPGGRIFLRDGTSILGRRYLIENRWSELLKADYSAVYRTPEEYKQLFASQGLHCMEDADMFDESCPLNKYPETRLRFYVFERAGQIYG